MSAQRGAEGGGHEEVLGEGHGGDGNLRHVGGRDVERLGLAGCPDPPHLAGNRK